MSLSRSQFGHKIIQQWPRYRGPSLCGFKSGTATTCRPDNIASYKSLTASQRRPHGLNHLLKFGHLDCYQVVICHEDRVETEGPDRASGARYQGSLET